ncbi:MAG: nickel-binding protein [Roseiflexaceae bacterium]
MPLFMDIHAQVEGLTGDAICHAHAADLKTQKKYRIKNLRYWFDENSSKDLCLVGPPNQAAVIAVDREA